MADPAKVAIDPAPTVQLIHGSTIKPQRIEWLWHEWLAVGKFHVLAGPPGTGKTTIASALAATLSCGGKWPDGTRAEAGNVLIWSGEDDPADTLAPRLMACDADMGRVYFVGDVADGDEVVTFDPAIHANMLELAAAKIGGIKLLIVDPIVSAVQGDSHKNAEVRRGLQPLVALASNLGCAVLGISHFSKGTAGRDPVERVTGSIAFGALARVVFAAARMPESDQEGGARLFCRSKSNIGIDSGGFRYDLGQVELPDHPGVFASQLLWGDSIEGSAHELLKRADSLPEESESGGKRLPQDVWLFDYLTYGPKPCLEIIDQGKAAGFSSDQLRRARERLGVVSEKSGYQKEWYWSLPEGTFSAENGKGGKDGSDFECATEQKPSATFAMFDGEVVA